MLGCDSHCAQILLLAAHWPSICGKFSGTTVEFGYTRTDSGSIQGTTMWIPRPQKHWTLSYMRDRFRQIMWQRAHPRDPWLTRDAVEFLRQWLRPGDLAVEFGSGRSTIWFARCIQPNGHIISVEDHEGWHRDVSERLKALGLANYTYRLSIEEPGPYVGAAQEELAKRGGLADFILVDGSARDLCAVWGLEHIKPGGVIAVDNVQRYLPHKSNAPTAIPADGKPASEVWGQFFAAVSGWRQYWTSDGVEDTAFFFAPQR